MEKDGCKFRGEPLSTWYLAFVTMACYAFGELGHFLIGTISKPMSEEIKFGSQGCYKNAMSEFSNSSADECHNKNKTWCEFEELNNITHCTWGYTGSGIEYQILAGPAFIAIFTVCGILIGVAGDIFNRIRLLSACVVLFSISAFLTGFSTEYWHLVILRMFFAAGEAGCTPLSASLIADKFSSQSRGLAMSLFNWGIYIGYGLAFTFGIYVTDANIMDLGWRMTYYLSGLPGIVMALILLLSLKEPNRKAIHDKKVVSVADSPQDDSDDKITTEIIEVDAETNQGATSFFSTLWNAIKFICNSPTILVLLLAAAIRHTASFCWAYNAKLYFNYYFPESDIGIWMTVCSIVGGSFGIAVGGMMSDLVVSRHGISTRLWVLVISQTLAAPLAVLVLYLSPPFCFIALFIAYFFAEMWFGVLFTVLVELFPLRIRTSAIAVFIFVINNVASGGQLTVTYLRAGGWPFRLTLYVAYPGYFALSSFLFLVTQLMVRRQSSLNVGKLSSATKPVASQCCIQADPSSTGEESTLIAVSEPRKRTVTNS